MSKPTTSGIMSPRDGVSQCAVLCQARTYTDRVIYVQNLPTIPSVSQCAAHRASKKSLYHSHKNLSNPIALDWLFSPASLHILRAVQTLSPTFGGLNGILRCNDAWCRIRITDSVESSSSTSNSSTGCSGTSNLQRLAMRSKMGSLNHLGPVRNSAREDGGLLHSPYILPQILLFPRYRPFPVIIAAFNHILPDK
jgi:hypothetical protein